MAANEESPAQQAARLRRERREAKIKAGGSARLDKITSLSGRTPLNSTIAYCFKLGNVRSDSLDYFSERRTVLLRRTIHLDS